MSDGRRPHAHRETTSCTAIASRYRSSSGASARSPVSSIPLDRGTAPRRSGDGEDEAGCPRTTDPRGGEGLYERARRRSLGCRRREPLSQKGSANALLGYERRWGPSSSRGIRTQRDLTPRSDAGRTRPIERVRSSSRRTAIGKIRERASSSVSQSKGSTSPREGDPRAATDSGWAVGGDVPRVWRITSTPQLATPRAALAWTGTGRTSSAAALRTRGRRGMIDYGPGRKGLLDGSPECAEEVLSLP